ncbi:ATP synthase F0 subunit A [candidate division KSB1 bacterium]|nr:MAG: ATP synthase F0 subunit A [candidate division KSB1 bacterium]
MMNLLFLQETIQHGQKIAQKAGEHAVEQSNWILRHIHDENVFEFFGKEIHLPHFSLFGIDLSVTKHVVMLWFAAFLLIIILGLGARKVKLIPKGFANLLEILIMFVRDEIVYVNFGKAGKPFVPFFLSLFFYIMFLNLLGLVPFCSTATANIRVTGGLAFISFILIQASGIKQNGLGGYLKNIVPPGLPIWLLPIMVPVEIIGMFAKPFALAIRLFANMTGGHTVIFVLIGMIITFKTWLVVPPPILMAAILGILEIFIALLQSYIFTFLTSLFISLTMFPEH